MRCPLELSRVETQTRAHRNALVALRERFDEHVVDTVQAEAVRVDIVKRLTRAVDSLNAVLMQLEDVFLSP
jgi:hypothetical protein